MQLDRIADAPSKAPKAYAIGALFAPLHTLLWEGQLFAMAHAFCAITAPLVRQREKAMAQWRKEADHG
jgi:hypothetical protein